MKSTNKSQKKKVVTFVGDGVLHLWAFVTLVGVVTFVGATTVKHLFLESPPVPVPPKNPLQAGFTPS